MKKVKKLLKANRMGYYMDGEILVISCSIVWPDLRDLLKKLDEMSGVFYSIHEGRFQIFKLK